MSNEVSGGRGPATTPGDLDPDEVSDALALAAEIHRQQRRKGTDVPYLAHLLAVAALTLEHGGDQDQAIAALLHDAVEDAPPEVGGDAVTRRIESRFGPRVARIVLDCTDATGIPKPPWRPRKAAYLAHLADVAPDSALVAAADKLHNARSLLRDVRREGPCTWDRFHAGPLDQLWYYTGLADGLRRALGDVPIVDELSQAVVEMEVEIGRGIPSGVSALETSDREGGPT